MSLASRAVFAAAVAVLLAGCAGGGSVTSAVPAAARVASSVSRAAVAPTGTLYAAGITIAYAYPLAASGATAPVRTITPHANQTNHRITGLATNADGTPSQNYIRALAIYE